MNRAQMMADLAGVVGPGGVVTDAADLMAYESDGFPLAKATPAAVVFPTSLEQVVGCVGVLRRHGVGIVPRGSGTGLAGACTAYGGGVLIVTSRMNRIVEVDLAGRTACVEAGVRNTQLTEHVQRMPGGENLQFSPDPSSQRAATIGGNVATNAGGSHTLKYGVTTNHVLGLEMVLPDATVVRVRPGGVTDGMGADLAGLICGSEGTMGIITRVWVRLSPKARAFRTIVGIYDASRAACQSVADVIASGIVPAAMEMMDGAMVRVVEEAFDYGFPTDAQALLLIEVDGVEAALDGQMNRVVEICRRNGARDVQCSADPRRRAELWSARKRAFGAIGRLSPTYVTQDACVPRSKLPEVIDRVAEIGQRFGLTITNVFHAGDGNVHPILVFNEHDPRQVRAVLEASYEILRYCISIGGSLTGEHGVGVEKLPLMGEMFDAATMELFDRLKKTFDPDEMINVGKLIPSKKLHIDLLSPAHVGVPGGAMV